MNIKTINDTSLKSLEILIANGFIPDEGNFEVDENLLYCHRQIYASFGNGAKCDYTGPRRYAGKAFLELKKYRKIPVKDIKEGYIYMIKNPVWPNKTKIGITTDLSKRLSSYQTYDPDRNYYIASYEFVLNKKTIEKQIIEKFSVDLDKGEWISDSDCEKIIKFIRSDFINHYKKESIISDREGNFLKINDFVMFSYKNCNIKGKIKSFRLKTIEVITKNKKYFIHPKDLIKVKI